jgi:RNA polymerase sigma-70 factor (ECF subfamily)
MEYALLPDERLLRLLKADDEVAFKELYDRYFHFVFVLIIKKGCSKEVAEELSQQIFMTIWEKRATLDIKLIQNYLSISVKNRVLNYIKACLVRNAYAKHAGKIKRTSDNESQSVLLMHELSEAIDKAIRQLPQKSQLIFKLSRFEMHSIREIAQIMDISEKTVEYHISQSLKTLRFHLKDFI